MWQFATNSTKTLESVALNSHPPFPERREEGNVKTSVRFDMLSSKESGSN